MQNQIIQKCSQTRIVAHPIAVSGGEDLLKLFNGAGSLILRCQHIPQ